MKSKEHHQVNNQVVARIPSVYGEFNLYYFTNTIDGKEHMAIAKGDLQNGEHVLTRMHSECFTGDVLGSQRCDCGEQLALALQMIGDSDTGVLIYLRQEGRGIGLLKKLQAYNLQDEGMDTVDANLHLGHEADERNYEVAALILKDLGVKSVRLMTNNPMKISALNQFGINVTERVSLEVNANKHNRDYLQTKIKKLSHLISGSN
ncbi:MAG: GTP cyclohydrolase II [Gammaproteobacteria bacterium]|nr:GTP cyclohydrolase II [Gammaproteobacteria bacterium]